MVAGMVMRVRSLPIMFFISDHRLKPLPSGRGMGSRVRTPLDCRRREEDWVPDQLITVLSNCCSGLLYF